MGNDGESPNTKVVVAVIGAVATVLAAAIGAWIGLADRDDENDGPPNPQVGCSVSGAVYNTDFSPPRPFAGMRVGYVPRGTTFSGEESFRYLAETSPSGTFRLDCGGVPSGYFLAFQNFGWGGCIHVSPYSIPTMGQHHDANFNISNKVMTTLGDLRGVPKNDNCEFRQG